VPPNISGSPNAMACVNKGMVPSASPPASTQYQKNLWLPEPVIGHPSHILDAPSKAQTTQLSLACNWKDNGTLCLL
jgi:hypothetical protein